MLLKDALICWTSNTQPQLLREMTPRFVPGDVLVMPFKDDHGESRRLMAWSGARYDYVRKLPRIEAMLYTQALALELIMFYKCDPLVVEREFSKIEEYRRAGGILMGCVMSENLEIFRNKVRDPQNTEGYWGLA